MVEDELMNLQLEWFFVAPAGHELQHRAIRAYLGNGQSVVRTAVRQWHHAVGWPVRTFRGHQYMQPNHLNLIYPLVKTEHAGVAGLNNQRPNRDQRWKLFVFPLQETDSFRHTSRRKVGA